MDGSEHVAAGAPVMDEGLCREVTVLLLKVLGDESPEGKEGADRLGAFLNMVEEFGWERVAQCARSALLSPLLCHALYASSASASVPRLALDALREDHLRSLCRNMRILQAVSEILAECNAKDISVILLKGAALAVTVYKDPGLRPMGDVDILVRRQDIPEVHAILTGKGYRSHAEQDMMMANHVPQYILPGRPTIEVHFTILEEARAARFDVERLFERAVPADLLGVKTSTLAPEDGMLHLCEHAAAHHVFGNGIRSIVDVARLTEKYKDRFDWEIAWARAGEWGIRRSVALCLSLCERYVGLAVPRYVQDWLSAQEGSEQSLERAESILFTPDEERDGSLAFARFLSAKTLRARLQILRGVFFPPRRMLFSITGYKPKELGGRPSGVFPLYVRRAAGLWRRHRRAAFHALFGNGGGRDSGPRPTDSSVTRLSLLEWLQKSS